MPTSSVIICSHFSGISGENAIANIDAIGTLFEQILQPKVISLNFKIYNFDSWDHFRLLYTFLFLERNLIEKCY